MWLSAVLILSVAGGFSCPPTTLEQLAPNLSDALGVEVRVAADLRNEVVAIEAPQKSIDEVKERLAHAVCGRWVAIDAKTIRLEKDDQEEARRRQNCMAELTTGIDRRKHAISTQLQTLSLGDANPEILAKLIFDCQDIDRGYRNFPLTDIASRLLLDIPSSELAEAYLAGGAEYSTHPVGGQRDLGDKARASLAKAIRDQRELIKHLGRLKWHEHLIDPDMLDWLSSSSASTSLDIILTPHSAEAGLHEGAGAKPPGEQMHLMSLMESPWPARKADISLNLQLSNKPWQEVYEDRGFNKLVQASLKHGAAASLRRAPGEPLDSGFNGFFSKWAKAEGRPLVACIPDGIAWQLQHRVPDFSAAATVNDLKVREREGWIEIIPQRPWQVRQERLDRRIISKLASIIQSGRLMTISEQVEDAAVLKTLFDGSTAIDLAVHGLVDPTILSGSYGEPKLSLLSAATRKMLNTGGMKPWSRMSDTDRKAFEEIVLAGSFINIESRASVSEDWSQMSFIPEHVAQISRHRLWARLDPAQAGAAFERDLMREGRLGICDPSIQPGEWAPPAVMIGPPSLIASAQGVDAGWIRNAEVVVVFMLDPWHRVKIRGSLWEGEFKTKLVDP